MAGGWYCAVAFQWETVAVLILPRKPPPRAAAGFDDTVVWWRPHGMAAVITEPYCGMDAQTFAAVRVPEA